MTEIRAPFKVNRDRVGPNPTPGGIGVAGGGNLLGDPPVPQPVTVGEAIVCAIELDRELGRLESVLTDRIRELRNCTRALLSSLLEV